MGNSKFRGNDFEKVSEMIREEIVDVDVRDPSYGGGNATGLMMVSVSGDVEIAALLISLDADVDAVDSINGWTALMQVN